MKIPFNKPYMTGKEVSNINQAYENGMIAGDGPFTKKCEQWLEDAFGVKKSLLTHSCTAALEMAAILINVQQGDEIIMPSYTFVSTANAFVLRGAVPVFIDVCEQSLNIDPNKIEQEITDKTKAIVVVHYAGVSCDMGKIMQIAKKYDLFVIEDAAQAFMSTYKGKYLGAIGDIGTYSFHETKNITSGEGGAILLNNDELIERAEIIREKGTNRKQFFRGQVDKYTWVDIGSSFLPGELVAAFLYAQLEDSAAITQRRLDIWNNYHSSFEALEKAGKVKRPELLNDCHHNAHMYYLLLENLETRTALIEYLKSNDIGAVFHYIPLHNSEYGKQVSKSSAQMPVTQEISDTLVRLPFWVGVEKYQDFIVEKIYAFFNN